MKKPPYDPIADLKLQIRAGKLPEAIEEHRFGQSIKRLYRFDWAWPEQGIALEYEGGTWAAMSSHMHPMAYEEDAIKYSLAAGLGWKVIRCTSKMVRDGTALTLLLFAFGRIAPEQVGPMTKRAKKHKDRVPGESRAEISLERSRAINLLGRGNRRNDRGALPESVLRALR